MRKITDIYEEYKITPNLQEHQLRVTAVAKWIVDNWTGQEINKEEIIVTALLHDMGNIIKFNLEQSLELFPQFYSKDSIVYWESVKKEYIEKYGSNAHEATQLIVEELGNPMGVANIVGRLGFRNTPKFLDELEYSTMIVQYSDMRVSPTGIQSTTERLADFYKRYYGRPDFENLYPEREEAKKSVYEIENIILKNTNETLLVLSNENLKEIIEELKNFEI